MRLISILLAAILFGTTSLAGQLEEGVEAYVRKDYATALRLWRPLAERGDVAAQSHLGFMYMKGDGVAQNYTEAMKWTRLAAEQGNTEALSLIGTMYFTGQGVPPNQAQAAEWYRLAAEQGNDRSQYSLGSMYLRGMGVEQNHVLAHMWLNLAASRGNAKAVKDREIAANNMKPAQITLAQKLAAEWMPKTWEQLKQQMPK